MMSGAVWGVPSAAQETLFGACGLTVISATASCVTNAGSSPVVVSVVVVPAHSAILRQALSASLWPRTPITTGTDTCIPASLRVASPWIGASIALVGAGFVRLVGATATVRRGRSAFPLVDRPGLRCSNCPDCLHHWLRSPATPPLITASVSMASLCLGPPWSCLPSQFPALAPLFLPSPLPFPSCLSGNSRCVRLPPLFRSELARLPPPSPSSPSRSWVP